MTGMSNVMPMGAQKGAMMSGASPGGTMSTGMQPTTPTTGLGQSKSIGGGIKRVKPEPPKDTKLKPDEWRRKLEDTKDRGRDEDRDKDRDQAPESKDEMPSILGE
jgi:hypothetical protein